MNTLRGEPVRAAFVTLIVAVLGLLVSLGVIDDGTSATIAAAVTAMIGALGEVTRSKVSPVPDIDFKGLVFADDEGAVDLGGVVQIALGIVLAVVLLCALLAIF